MFRVPLACKTVLLLTFVSLMAFPCTDRLCAQPSGAQKADAKLRTLLSELQKKTGVRFVEQSDDAGVYFVCEVRVPIDSQSGSITYRNVFVWAEPYLVNGKVLQDHLGNEVVMLMFESMVYALPEGLSAAPSILKVINQGNESGGWVTTYLSKQGDIRQKSHSWLRTADTAILDEELLELAFRGATTAEQLHPIVQSLVEQR